MNATSLIITQAAASLLAALAAIWFATAYVAAALGYDRALGEPWFFVLGAAVYHPWRLFEWWYVYEQYAPDVFARAGAIATAGGLLAAAFALAGALVRERRSANVATFGSARWADEKDVEEAGLKARAGVFLGKFGGDYLRHDGDEHVIALAPTRSGKGVGLVVPTLLAWDGSAVIHDIKGENWKATAGWRSTFSRCILFDPTSPCSARYNPLLEVRRGENEVRDAQNIADILVDPEGSLEKRNHWEVTGHALLVGVILHVLYAEKEKTLARAAAFLSDPHRSFERTLAIMMTTNHLGGEGAPIAHPVVAQAAREVMNKSENERSGVLSTAMSFLGLYRDPTVARATGGSDWRISDLADATRAASLYLVTPPSDLSRTRPLMRLVLNQIGRRLTETHDEPRARARLLLMLDEFPALGRLDFFETALAYIAGYGIKAYLIAQSFNQLDKAYGPNNSIVDNCHVRIAFTANDERTARRISDALGAATHVKLQRHYSGSRLASWLSHVSVSRQETARPLLTPGEVLQLPKDEAIVLVSGAPPIRARRLQYFRDRNFLERLRPPPAPHQTQAPQSSEWAGVAAPADERLADAPIADVAQAGELRARVVGAERAGGEAGAPAPSSGSGRARAGILPPI